MALPFFYIETFDADASSIVLSEETSKHMIQVLRMHVGDQIQLADGIGKKIIAEITDDNRKKCTVQIVQTTNHKPPTTNLTIAISLIKNTTRFEWFLEKATEIGVTTIIPLICKRTEKQNFRHDRMNAILISAMLQSQQCWLPVLREPTKFNAVISSTSDQQKFIAHCVDEEKRNLADMVNENLSSKIILIGPEGDFTPGEIDMAVKHHFIPVALGNTRLRTETAGVVAASLLCLI